MHLYEEPHRTPQEILLDAIVSPVYLLDRELRYLAFNDAHRRVMAERYGTRVAVGASVFDSITDADDRDAARAVFGRTMAGETSELSPWFGRDDDPVLTVTYAPAISDGEVSGLTAVTCDVSQLTEALRLAEAKFEAAFRASPDAIAINRLSDGMYVDINDGFTQMTGYSAADVNGKTSYTIAIWNDPADREHVIDGLNERGTVDCYEAAFRRKDGSVATAEMSARIISLAGDRCILSVTRDISARKRMEAALEASNAHLERMSHDIVQTLGRVVEARDPYTQGHEERSAGLCRLIATEMGMDESTIEELETAALVHDIGKLDVPTEILTKPGLLSPVEFGLIKEHPRSGYEILKDISFDWPIAELVLQHHERLDGSGYPAALHGDEIGMPARILAVADVVEAMATHRPYRPSLGLDAAVDELRSHPEKYDADVVKAFVDLNEAGAVTV